jgi:hypothetical protein
MQYLAAFALISLSGKEPSIFVFIQPNKHLPQSLLPQVLKLMMLKLMPS